MKAFGCTTIDKEGKPIKLWDINGVHKLETMLVPPYTQRLLVLDITVIELNLTSEQEARLQHAIQAMDVIHSTVDSNDTVH